MLRNLKSWLFLFLLPFAFSLQAANKQRVRDLDIQLTLLSKGGIVVCEKWDINTGDDITEWYLVRQNLGDIEIRNFSVLDENGNRFEDDGEWDVERSLSQKAGRSGIVHKKDGVELCWGVGSHGDHVFRAIYGMTHAIKSLHDYDMLHLQVVSPGLSSPPEHVKVTIDAKDLQLDTLNTRAWGFGFGGRTSFEDGKVVLESTEPLKKSHSVIVLLRLDKGYFASESIQDRDFQDALDIAMEGADFGDGEEEEDPVSSGIAMFFTILIMYLVFRKPVRSMLGKKSKREIRQVAGISNLKNVNWYREIPLEGNLDAAHQVLTDLGVSGKKNNLALAEILRLVHGGYLKASRALEGPIKLTFTDKDFRQLDPSAQDFYKILKDAAGGDHVLEDKEFSSWARGHDTEVYNWSSEAITRSLTFLKHKAWRNYGKYSREGQTEVRHLVGLRKFLEDFTLVKERETVEAGLWKEYLVYAALFGLAEKVSRQLKDIDPALFAQTFPFDPEVLPSLLVVSESLASSLRSAVVTGNPHYSSGDGGSSDGYGGSTSYGGGGGFSGGGYGGGGR